jgi:hypothetical protein
VVIISLSLTQIFCTENMKMEGFQLVGEEPDTYTGMGKLVRRKTQVGCNYRLVGTLPAPPNTHLSL